MSDPTQNDLRNQYLAATFNNNSPADEPFAIRGIGPYGQDVLAHTILAPNPAAALARIITLKPVEARSATAWVVTLLRK